MQSCACSTGGVHASRSTAVQRVDAAGDLRPRASRRRRPRDDRHRRAHRRGRSRRPGRRAPPRARPRRASCSASASARVCTTPAARLGASRSAARPAGASQRRLRRARDGAGRARPRRSAARAFVSATRHPASSSAARCARVPLRIGLGAEHVGDDLRAAAGHQLGAHRRELPGRVVVRCRGPRTTSSSTTATRRVVGRRAQQLAAGRSGRSSGAARRGCTPRRRGRAARARPSGAGQAALRAQRLVGVAPAPAARSRTSCAS